MIRSLVSCALLIFLGALVTADLSVTNSAPQFADPGFKPLQQSTSNETLLQLVSVQALNNSTRTQCAEEDNINIPLRGNITSFVIEATHPEYEVDEYTCEPNFTNCPPSGTTYSFNSSVEELYDDGVTIVEAVRNDTWWQPSGMTASALNKTMNDTHYIRIYRKIEDANEWPQFFVLYMDGNLRVIPHPPEESDSVCFGSSVLVGPAINSSPSSRPIAEITSVEYFPDSDSVKIIYKGGGTADIKIKQVDRNKTRLQVNANYSTDKLPFACFRSMFVEEGNADVDHMNWKNDFGWHNKTIMGFNGGNGFEWFFYRSNYSRHNPSAPDIYIKTLSKKEAVPNISVSHSIDFGSIEVGNSINETLTVLNNGTANLSIHTIITSNTEFNLIEDKCSGKTLPPSNSCDVNISFIPTSAGSKSATLNIASNDLDTPNVTVNLSGEGLNKPPLISFVDPTPPNNTVTAELYFLIKINSSEPLSTCLLEWNETNVSMVGSDISWLFNQTLDEGEHHYRVCGNDPANNWNCTPTRVIKADRTSPTINKITIDPSSPEVNSSVNVSVDVDDPHIQAVRVNLTYPNDSFSSNDMLTNDNVTFNFSFFVKAYGDYKVKIVAQDLAGNINNTLKYFVAVITAFNSTIVQNDTTVTLFKNEHVVINVTANATADGEVTMNTAVSPSPYSFGLTEINNDLRTVNGIKYLNMTSELNNITRIRIELHYSDDEIPLIDEDSMAVYYWNGSAWINCSNYVGETVPDGPFVFDAGNNPDKNYVYVEVNHSSYFGLGGYLDSDGDGFLDINDECPNDPENFNGYQDGDGCPDSKPVRRSSGGGGGGGLLLPTPTPTATPTATPIETPSSVSSTLTTPEETPTITPTPSPTEKPAATPTPQTTTPTPSWEPTEIIVVITVVLAAIAVIGYFLWRI